MSNNIFSMSALSRYSELFQIVGVIGLIASLIFVGLELRQTQKIATANTQQERNYSMVNMFNTFTLNNIDWQSVAFENKTNYQFTKNEIARRNLYHYSWFVYENDYFQHSQGLVSNEVWNAKKKAFEVWYNTCDLRPLYFSRAKYMPLGFRELVESFPDKC
jgi:hypothetical protein